ncbi:tetratricopeptide repeat protein [Desulforhopalus vacuolatus]|uniref:tetratricopeptide repeat protein n=1 Tax=Desulforhopalus vacuolatus TaxID=40414 RepID=UPI0019629AA4|nr:tetratricopeptide repeat protein [Desulforhopalus vacuolatus]MBM9520786.1 tetratricopeptide repeat protein [Desulforhopalus vacuolatus]
MKRLLAFTMLLLFLVPGMALADKKYPPVVGIALSKAVPLMRQKQYAEATAILQQALGEKGGTHEEIYLQLGNCAMLQGTFSLAVQHYKEALKGDDTAVSLWLNLGKAQYQLKHFAGAGDSFQQAWDRASPQEQKADILFCLATAWRMAGNGGKAVVAFEKLFQLYPKKVTSAWREQYIHALMESEQIKKALPLIRQMIATSSGKMKMQWQEILLSQYVELQMYSQAETLARTLTEADPGEVKWWKALAHLQLAAGRMEQALAALIACSYLEPLDAQELTLLADLYMETNVPGKAAPLYRQLLQRKYRQRTLQRLVVALHREDKDETALKVLQQYREETVKSASLLQLEGEIRYGRREFFQAAEAYRVAAGLKGHQKGRCWLMAGYSALQGKDWSAARQYLHKASEFKRQKKPAWSALKVVQMELARASAG